MTQQCSSPADSITGVLLAGDAVLNFSSQPLNTVAGTRFVICAEDCLQLSECPQQIQWSPSMADRLPQLLSDQITRIVLVSDEGCALAEAALPNLAELDIAVCHCVVRAECAADAFMDEADAEAVAERLRQLGYL